MSVSIKSTIFATIATNNGDNLQPEVKLNSKIFATTTTKNGQDLTSSIKFSPSIFVTTITNAGGNLGTPIKFAPKIFAIIRGEEPAELNVPINFKPRVFATVVSPKEPPTQDIAKADTLLIVVKSFRQARADTLIHIVDRATADTCRKIIRVEKSVADTIIRVPHILKYVVENSLVLNQSLLRTSPPSLVNSFKDYGIASFSVSLNERTLSDNFQLEATTRPMDINEAVSGQLLDYPFSFLVEETSQQDLLQSVKGMYDVDKLLYSLFSLSGTIAAEDVIRVSNNEERTEKEKPTTASEYIAKMAEYQNFTCNILFDDFTPYPSIGGEYAKVTYKDVLDTLFSWTSRVPQRQINVFIRGGTLHCIQRGKEKSTFDITDIPHSRPSVSKKIIRTLWNKPDVDDDSYSTSRKSSKSDDQTPFYNIKDLQEQTRKDPIGEWQEEEIDYPYTGTISYEDKDTKVYIKYHDGLVVQEYNSMENASTTTSSKTTFDYLNFEGTAYLTSKVTINRTSRINDVGNREVVTQIVSTDNTYFYTSRGAYSIYLGSESEKTETETNEYTADGTTLIDSDTSTTIRKTYHTPIGNGWYAQSVYVDGEAQGSNLSQGKPSNAVSPYTVKQINQNFVPIQPVGDDTGDDTGGDAGDDTGGDAGGDISKDTSEGTYNDDWRNRLKAIVDTTFPVMEYEILKELTDAVLWLNRKIQEEISVDLIAKIDNGVPSINHIVDFTERILLDGNEYYLVSNSIELTPRKFIQRLTLVRWYAQ